MSDQPFFDSPPVHKLNASGLNLTAVFDLTKLPAEILDSLREQNIDLHRYKRLVILGNGGKRFWDALEVNGLESDHPIDAFSLAQTYQFIEDISAEDDHHLILYPRTDYVIPLQKLGILAGWGGPSPIGNSINPKYGLWFAFRSAFLTTVEIPENAEDQQPSPCESCVEKPCQSACPAGAVHLSAQEFELTNCISHRLQPESSCTFTCLARLACPVGNDHRYPSWAIKQLYGVSIDGIKRWRASQQEEK